MDARENLWKEGDDLKNYLTQINWDRTFFKVQMILGAILLGAIMVYLFLY